MSNIKKEPTHVDDWVDRFDMGKQSLGQKYARFCLFLFRLSAVFHIDWAEWIKEHKLFCTFEDKRYRVTGASRMGDVWLTPDFNRDKGYSKRVNVDSCSEWSDSPGKYIGILGLTDETFDASLKMLTTIRGVNGMTVVVSAEELACLMHKARDNEMVVNSLCSSMEWVQDVVNSGQHTTLPGFPVDEYWGKQYPDVMHLWIDNLLKLVGHKTQ